MKIPRNVTREISDHLIGAAATAIKFDTPVEQFIKATLEAWAIAKRDAKS